MNTILQTEDFGVNLDVFDICTKEELDINANKIDFLVFLYTDRYHPIVLSTYDDYYSRDSFLKTYPFCPLKVEGYMMYAVVPAEYTQLLSPGNISLEVKARMRNDEWRSVGIMKNIAQILPSCQRL